MFENHPITVPAGSITGWKKLYRETYQGDLSETEYIATQATRWGADQELEACCEYLTRCAAWAAWEPEDIQEMRDLRRPKPPSLKEQALEALQFVDEKLDLPLHNHCNAIHTIRRALEALPND
jgi:hypothetical protein